MAGKILHLYHRLPPQARSWMATAKGARLRYWRRGPQFEQHVAAALERDHWTSDQWQTWQDARIGRMLDHAACNVPYYRSLWQERRRRGDKRPWDVLQNWPVLEKEALRQAPRAFLADGVNPRRLLHLHTSGTTGKPLSVWQSRAVLTEWYALIEARRLRWFGVSYRDRWALIGGQLVTPVAQNQPPFWVWNAALKQLYMSSYHLSPDLLPAYLDALRAYRVRYLWGYSSSLYALARAALEQGATDLRMAVSLTSAEPLLDHQREAIEDAFGPVCETYGMTEIAAAASACPHGTLHDWPDAGVIELLDGDAPAPAGESGDVVATGLINQDMPLIRYRVGDRAAFARDGSICSCGRRLPQIARIEGRIDDMLFTRDGRRIGRMDPVFKADLPILEAQIIQERIDLVRVRVVPARGYSAEGVAPIKDEIRKRLGDVSVQIEPVATIPRSANAKFKAVVCNIAAEDLPEAPAMLREQM